MCWFKVKLKSSYSCWPSMGLRSLQKQHNDSNGEIKRALCLVKKINTNEIQLWQGNKFWIQWNKAKFLDAGQKNTFYTVNSESSLAYRHYMYSYKALICKTLKKNVTRHLDTYRLMYRSKHITPVNSRVQPTRIWSRLHCVSV